MPFKEALPNHFSFVVMCFMDWMPFWRARSKYLRDWVRKLDPRAGVPCRATCIKILGLIRTLMEAKLLKVVTAHALKFGNPHG